MAPVYRVTLANGNVAELPTLAEAMQVMQMNVSPAVVPSPADELRVPSESRAARRRSTASHARRTRVVRIISPPPPPPLTSAKLAELFREGVGVESGALMRALHVKGSRGLKNALGLWAERVGLGKAADVDRLFVVGKVGGRRGWRLQGKPTVQEDTGLAADQPSVPRSTRRLAPADWTQWELVLHEFRQVGGDVTSAAVAQRIDPDPDKTPAQHRKAINAAFNYLSENKQFIEKVPDKKGHWRITDAGKAYKIQDISEPRA